MDAPRLFPVFFAMIAAFAAGCASSRQQDEAPNPVDEASAFTPIRVKYATATPADLAGVDTVRIAVVDVDFSGDVARMALVPASYRPLNGVCQLLEERTECDAIADLVKAIDAHVDRMPFGVLFTYKGKVSTDSAVMRDLPPAYGDFYASFQAAMKAEDIDYVLLMPEKVVFLR